MCEDVPLVIPEINPEHLGLIEIQRENRGWDGALIKNPNCSVITLAPTLKALDIFGLESIHVSTLQAVSGAGKSGMDELFNQTRGVYMNEPEHKFQETFQKRIAFNVIPHIDVFMEDGATKEEWKMMVETKKILDPQIKVHATCVRVPVFIGHAEAVNLELESPLTAENALFPA